MKAMLIVCVGFSLLLSACAESGTGPVVSSGERYAPGSGTASAGGVTDYRLGVGDKIRIVVFNEPALSGEFAVAANGSLSLPLIGAVSAKDKTIEAVAEDARARFADGYLREPKVSAEVINYRSFFILGEVETPGQYPYAVGLTAMNAVATAKGFTPRANRDVVQIRREGETQETTYRLTPELLVYPGDTIRVGERYF